MNYISNNTKKNPILSFYLNKYYGLNKLSSELICKILGYDIHIRIQNLTDKDWKKIELIIKMKFKFSLNEEVRKVVIDNIQNMRNIKCYRGVRHLYGLPANNRRTKTNAKNRSWR